MVTKAGIRKIELAIVGISALSAVLFLASSVVWASKVAAPPVAKPTVVQIVPLP